MFGKIIEKIFRNRGFKRVIGLPALVMIGIGASIEASIFVLLGEGVKIAGALLPISFVFGGSIALLAAFVYAKIASIRPVSGADISFMFEIFKSRPFAFGLSWLIVLGDLSFIALNALGLGIYLNNLLGLSEIVIALISIVIVAVINIYGIKKTSLIESTLVCILLIFLVSFIVSLIIPADFRLLTQNYLHSDYGPVWLILSGTALIFTTFIGYEDITSVSAEVVEPGKVIPRALIYTVIITTIIYTALAFLLVSNLPVVEIITAKVPLINLAEKIRFPVSFVYTGAVIAVATTLVATILVASRKMFALFQEVGVAPTLLKINKQGVPARLVLILTLISIFLIISGSVTYVAYISNGVYLIGLIANTIGVIIFERGKRHLDTTYKIPGHPYSLYLLILFASTLIFFTDKKSLLSVLIWLIVGLVIFFLAKRFKNLGFTK